MKKTPIILLLTIITLTITATTIANAALVGEWHLDQTFGSVLDFDGTDDYVYIPEDATAWSGVTQITVEAWIYPHTVDIGPGLDNQIRIISKDNGANNFMLIFLDGHSP